MEETNVVDADLEEEVVELIIPLWLLAEGSVEVNKN